MTNTDPTYQEMFEFCQGTDDLGICDDSDIDVAIFWFVDQYCDRKHPNLMRARNLVQYCPTQGSESSIDKEGPWIKDMYDDLEAMFT